MIHSQSELTYEAGEVERCHRTLWNLLRLTERCREYDFTTSEFTVRELFRTARCDSAYGAHGAKAMEKVREEYQRRLTDPRLHRVLQYEETDMDRVLTERTARDLNSATHAATVACMPPSERIRYFLSPSVVEAVAIPEV